ncbi:MAG: hypothetical protein DRP65_06410 [Planctomycetota bacterium]|nr:MAG: hypothetical protein DRP65_06410 [Planctomycetota bacterium]
MKSFVSDNKGYLILCAIILIAAVLYGTAGRSIVARIADSSGDTDAIKQQRIVLADKMAFLVLAAVLVCFLLYRLIFGRRENLIWALLIFTVLLIFVYKLNPANRILSFHGFMHTGMVYQILNGEIPPSNALMSGEKLPYPWGLEYTAAKISDVFNISPSYSFAVLNIVSLIVCMVLIYAVSRLLIKDSTANILSALIAIFAITVGNNYLLNSLKHIGLAQAYRGVPAFVKFSNINGIPLGLVFYLLFLYSIIKIFIDKRILPMALLFLLAVVGVGFFYPQFLPGVIAATVTSCLVNMLCRRMQDGAPCFPRSVTAMGLLIAGCSILYPYFASINSGVKGRIQFFNIKSLFMNAAIYIIICFPVLLIIFLNRKYLAKNVDRRVLVTIVSVTVATLGCYLCIHLTWTNEYKFSMLSMITLGILGGVAFRLMAKWCKKSVVFILLLLFMFPAFNNIYTRLRYFDFFELPYIEKGKYIYSRNFEENELYEWIRNNTNVEDVFIDTEPLLPVLAQRHIYVALDRQVQGRIVRSPGYSFLLADFFRLICGYERELIDKRTGIVYTIYSSNRNLTTAQKEDLFAVGNRVYVIVRKADIRSNLNKRGFEKVFQSARSNFLVYRLTK